MELHRASLIVLIMICCNTTTSEIWTINATSIFATMKKFCNKATKEHYDYDSD